MLKLISPTTDTQWQAYYHLRWRILRKPWGQPEDDEQDKMDNRYYHIMAIENNIISGIARLEFPDQNSAQLRYMAVDDVYQRQGIGRSIVTHMEQVAKDNQAHCLFLNARQNALGFYAKLGYKKLEKTYLLFDAIQHYKMQKIL